MKHLVVLRSRRYIAPRISITEYNCTPYHCTIAMFESTFQRIKVQDSLTYEYPLVSWRDKPNPFLLSGIGCKYRCTTFGVGSTKLRILGIRYTMTTLLPFSYADQQEWVCRLPAFNICIGQVANQNSCSGWRLDSRNDATWQMRIQQCRYSAFSPVLDREYSPFSLHHGTQPQMPL